MEDQEKSFLGVGWAFPPTFNKQRADVEMVTQNQDIKESLEIYFATRLGERVMRSDYGCIIHEYAFQSSNTNVLKSVEINLKNAIRDFEPRIIVHDVKAKRLNVDEGIINFVIDYEIQSTNIRDNIVFPFYINEGTNIK
jgi:phage baseplate assembly protein W